METGAGLEKNEAKTDQDDNDPIAKFRRIVVDPLVRSGMRKPHRFRDEEWRAELDQLGDALGGRSAVELDALRKFLMDKGVGKRRTTWPSPTSILGYANEVFAKHVAATGGNSASDRQHVNRFMGFYRRQSEIPPPAWNQTIQRRRSALFMLLQEEGAPSILDLHRAGYDLPADMVERARAEREAGAQ